MRLRAPDERVTVVDRVLGEVSYAAGEVDDFVIRKADGFPTYHFAVVVDDELMGVTHVLRAQEHLNNTPRHVALQRALGFRTPEYAHMPIIFNMDGSKMSKRDKAKAARAAAKAAMQRDAAATDRRLSAALGARHEKLAAFLAGENDDTGIAGAIAGALHVPLPEIEVSDFRASGYLPEAIVNFLALLGWSPGAGVKDEEGKDVEKFDLAFLGRHFSLERIGRGNAKFDRVKLAAFNQDYMKALSDAEFERRWREWCAEFAPEVVEKVEARGGGRFSTLSAAMKPRAKTFADAAAGSRWAVMADDEIEYDPKAVEKVLRKGEPTGVGGLDLLREVRAAIAGIEPFTAAGVQGAIDAFCAARGVGIGSVAQPLRVAMTGSAVSPPLGETLAVLGRESVLARIDRCVASAAHG